MIMQRRGFTLLEILVATAMVAMLLVALNTFIFSMSELWGARRDERNFDLHVGTVTRFLERELRTALLPPYTQAGAAAVTWKAPTGQIGAATGGGDLLLSFTLPSESRLLPWPVDPASTSANDQPVARPLPEVACALVCRPNEGLILLWHSQYETTFATDAPRETVISPLVTALEYEYFDTPSLSWDPPVSVPKPDPANANQLLLPNRLRLTFAYGNQTRTTVVYLPSAGQGLPAY